MLNKEVCKMCWIIQGKRWARSHDIFWADCRAMCPSEIVSWPDAPVTRSIHSPPPDQCPFGLEHIVANRQKQIDEDTKWIKENPTGVHITGRKTCGRTNSTQK